MSNKQCPMAKAIGGAVLCGSVIGGGRRVLCGGDRFARRCGNFAVTRQTGRVFRPFAHHEVGDQPRGDSRHRRAGEGTEANKHRWLLEPQRGRSRLFISAVQSGIQLVDRRLGGLGVKKAHHPSVLAVVRIFAKIVITGFLVYTNIPVSIIEFNILQPSVIICK